MSGILIERDARGPVEWGPHAIRVANDEVELIVTTDFGPRVLVYGPRGGKNVFGYLSPKEQAKATEFGEPWHIYGGHRLWHAPEDPVLSYVPDNAPVPARTADRTLIVGGEVERGTSLRKEMRISLDEHGSRVVVEHRIENAGREPVDLAVWALSVMAPSGTAIFPNAPFIPFPEALLPASRLVLWPYTSLGDPRFRIGPRYLRLRQDRNAKAAQKIGLFDPHHGWAAYALGEQLFMKRYAKPSATAKLVDLGCNVESFTDGSILELETLGAEVHLAPGAAAVHTEEWQLLSGVTLPDDDTAAERVLAPLLARTISTQ